MVTSPSSHGTNGYQRGYGPSGILGFKEDVMRSSPSRAFHVGASSGPATIQLQSSLNGDTPKLEGRKRYPHDGHDKIAQHQVFRAAQSSRDEVQSGYHGNRQLFQRPDGEKTTYLDSWAQCHTVLKQNLEGIHSRSDDVYGSWRNDDQDGSPIRPNFWGRNHRTCTKTSSLSPISETLFRSRVNDQEWQGRDDDFTMKGQLSALRLLDQPLGAEQLRGAEQPRGAGQPRGAESNLMRPVTARPILDFSRSTHDSPRWTWDKLGKKVLESGVVDAAQGLVQRLIPSTVLSGDPDTGGPDTGGPDTGGPDTTENKNDAAFPDAGPVPGLLALPVEFHEGDFFFQHVENAPSKEIGDPPGGFRRHFPSPPLTRQFRQSNPRVSSRNEYLAVPQKQGYRRSRSSSMLPSQEDDFTCFDTQKSEKTCSPPVCLESQPIYSNSTSFRHRAFERESETNVLLLANVRAIADEAVQQAQALVTGKVEQQRLYYEAHLRDLKRQLEEVAADRDEKLVILENYSKELSKLTTKLQSTQHELDRITPRLHESECRSLDMSVIASILRLRLLIYRAVTSSMEVGRVSASGLLRSRLYAEIGSTGSGRGMTLCISTPALKSVTRIPLASLLRFHLVPVPVAPSLSPGPGQPYWPEQSHWSGVQFVFSKSGRCPTYPARFVDDVDMDEDTVIVDPVEPDTAVRCWLLIKCLAAVYPKYSTLQGKFVTKNSFRALGAFFFGGSSQIDSSDPDIESPMDIHTSAALEQIQRDSNDPVALLASLVTADVVEAIGPLPPILCPDSSNPEARWDFKYLDRACEDMRRSSISDFGAACDNREEFSVDKEPIAGATAELELFSDVVKNLRTEQEFEINSPVYHLSGRHRVNTVTPHFSFTVSFNMGAKRKPACYVHELVCQETANGLNGYNGIPSQHFSQDEPASSAQNRSASPTKGAYPSSPVDSRFVPESRSSLQTRQPYYSETNSQQLWNPSADLSTTALNQDLKVQLDDVFRRLQRRVNHYVAQSRAGAVLSDSSEYGAGESDHTRTSVGKDYSTDTRKKRRHISELRKAGARSVSVAVHPEMQISRRNSRNRAASGNVSRHPGTASRNQVEKCDSPTDSGFSDKRCHERSPKHRDQTGSRAPRHSSTDRSRRQHCTQSNIDNCDCPETLNAISELSREGNSSAKSMFTRSGSATSLVKAPEICQSKVLVGGECPAGSNKTRTFGDSSTTAQFTAGASRGPNTSQNDVSDSAFDALSRELTSLLKPSRLESISSESLERSPLNQLFGPAGDQSGFPIIDITNPPSKNIDSKNKGAIETSEPCYNARKQNNDSGDPAGGLSSASETSSSSSGSVIAPSSPMSHRRGAEEVNTTNSSASSRAAAHSFSSFEDEQLAPAAPDALVAPAAPGALVAPTAPDALVAPTAPDAPAASAAPGFAIANLAEATMSLTSDLASMGDVTTGTGILREDETSLISRETRLDPFWLSQQRSLSRPRNEHHPTLHAPLSQPDLPRQSFSDPEPSESRKTTSATRKCAVVSSQSLDTAKQFPGSETAIPKTVIQSSNTSKLNRTVPRIEDDKMRRSSSENTEAAHLTKFLHDINDLMDEDSIFIE